ncbi:hydrogen gas-evolving membrane-bound hydrogenase subunit E [Spirochaeta dissipatitropha]
MRNTAVRRSAGFVLAMLGGLGFAVFLLTALAASAEPGADFILTSIADTGSINAATAILMDYRGFDTLGEASVIFTSVAVVLVILGTPYFPKQDKGLGILTRRALALLLPLFFLFPVYVIVNGHLSPGGGFQGGVSLSVLVILLHVVYGSSFAGRIVSYRFLSLTEYLSALAFAAAGIVGIAAGASFLSNAAAGFPLGKAGELLSAGLIPLLNVIVGCKVAAGLSCIFYAFAGEGERVKE